MIGVIIPTVFRVEMMYLFLISDLHPTSLAGCFTIVENPLTLMSRASATLMLFS